MVIRKATSTDADDLRVLYFEYLTRFPPREEQDMDLWRNLLDKFERAGASLSPYISWAGLRVLLCVIS